MDRIHPLGKRTLTKDNIMHTVYKKDGYHLSIEETKSGFVLIQDDYIMRETSRIHLTREEASNVVKYLRQAEQAHIDQYYVNVIED